jgi:hypothetical protein
LWIDHDAGMDALDAGGDDFVAGLQAGRDLDRGVGLRASMLLAASLRT